MHKHVLFLVAILVGSGQRVNAQVPEPHWWVPDQPCWSIAPDSSNGTAYLSGVFTQIGPANWYNVELDPVTGAPIPGPRGDQAVFEHVEDGQGGWYGCGYFLRFGPEARMRVVRVNADGSIHPWYPAVDGIVYDMALANGVVYMVGDFTTVNGIAQPYCAAVDPETGALVEWDPQLDAPALSVSVVGTAVYLGGQFTTVGGVNRPFLCAVTAADAALLAWNPSADGLTSLVRANTQGIAAIVNGLLRCYDAAGASLPTPDGIQQVKDIVLQQDTVYACGVLTNDPATSVVYAFPLNGDQFLNVEVNTLVLALEVQADKLYIGGHFLEVAGSPRYRVAALDRFTGALTPWAPMISSVVRNVDFFGGRVFLSGDFVCASGVQRKYMAEMDMASGLPTSWLPPDINGHPVSMVHHEGVLYFGGGFTQVNGQPRNQLAAYDLAAEQLLPWSPLLPFDAGITDLLIVGDTLYVVGIFDAFDGQPRTLLAAVSTLTHQLLPWAPSILGDDIAFVNQLSASGNILYFSGLFDEVGGQERHVVAAVDRATGAVSPWNPDLDADPVIHALLAHEGVVYMAHSTITLNGETVTGASAVDGITGTTTLWNTPAEFEPTGLAITDNALYLAGYYMYSVNGVPRGGIAQVDPLDGTLLDWDLSPEYFYSWNNEELVMVPAGQRLLMTGSITQDSLLIGPFFGVLGSDLPDAVADVSAAQGLLLVPNPASNLFQLKGLPTTARTVELVDAMGRTVLRTRANEPVDPRGLRSGIYHVQVKDGSGATVGKARVIYAP